MDLSQKAVLSLDYLPNQKAGLSRNKSVSSPYIREKKTPTSTSSNITVTPRRHPSLTGGTSEVLARAQSHLRSAEARRQSVEYDIDLLGNKIDDSLSNIYKKFEQEEDGRSCDSANVSEHLIEDYVKSMRDPIHNQLFDDTNISNNGAYILSTATKATGMGIGDNTLLEWKEGEKTSLGPNQRALRNESPAKPKSPFPELTESCFSDLVTTTETTEHESIHTVDEVQTSIIDGTLETELEEIEEDIDQSVMDSEPIASVTDNEIITNSRSPPELAHEITDGDQKKENQLSSNVLQQEMVLPDYDSMEQPDVTNDTAPVQQPKRHLKNDVLKPENDDQNTTMNQISSSEPPMTKETPGLSVPFTSTPVNVPFMAQMPNTSHLYFIWPASMPQPAMINGESMASQRPTPPIPSFQTIADQQPQKTIQGDHNTFRQYTPASSFVFTDVTHRSLYDEVMAKLKPNADALDHMLLGQVQLLEQTLQLNRGMTQAYLSNLHKIRYASKPK